MYARRMGQRTSGHISEYRDQIFHLSQAALCRELETFSLMGFHTPTLLKSILAVKSRWLARVLHTPSHLLTPQTLSTTSGDIRPFLDLIQQGFQSNFQYPSMQTTDDSTISSGSIRGSRLNSLVDRKPRYKIR